MTKDEFLKETANHIVDLEDQKNILKEEIKAAYQAVKAKEYDVDVFKKVITDRIKGVSPDENSEKHELYQKYVEAVY